MRYKHCKSYIPGTVKRTKTQEVEPSKTAQKILESAAELIITTSNREVKISELARKAKVSRASIHLFFGKDAKNIVYQQILKTFIQSAQDKIELGLKLTGPEATPIERLVAVFRATAEAFGVEPLFGKVVLQQLNLGKAEENKIIFGIFKHVDHIIAEARRGGELSEKALPEDWKIRQLLFVVTRGLLRTMYFGEGHENPNKNFTENEVEIEILRILQLYCSKKPYEKIEKIIGLLSQTGAKGRTVRNE